MAEKNTEGLIIASGLLCIILSTIGSLFTGYGPVTFAVLSFITVFTTSFIILCLLVLGIFIHNSYQQSKAESANFIREKTSIKNDLKLFLMQVKDSWKEIFSFLKQSETGYIIRYFTREFSAFQERISNRFGKASQSKIISRDETEETDTTEPLETGEQI